MIKCHLHGCLCRHKTEDNMCKGGKVKNSLPQKNEILYLCNLHLLLEVCIIIPHYFFITKTTKGTEIVMKG